MTHDNRSTTEWVSDSLPLTKKREMLQALSEDDFRDEVIRPLYKRRRVRCIRENCGPEERGSDAVFIGKGPLDEEVLISVQTKRGNISHASDESKNVISIITQLNMAMETEIVYDSNSKRSLPGQVHLCTSGKISVGARQHIYDKTNTQIVKIFDVDEVIDMIDGHMKEYWLGVSISRLPYAKAMRTKILNAVDEIRLSDISGATESSSPVVDENYLSLRVVKFDQVPERHRGELVIRNKF